MTGQGTMKAISAPTPGGPDAIIIHDARRPIAGLEELLIRVTAIGVNRVDAMQRSGIYPPPPGVGDILGVEFAGEVAATGPDAGDYAVGDRVFGLVPGGSYAEYVAVHHRHVARTPADWDDVTAGAVIETVATANETLFELGRLAAGERLLIHAAGSAVGTTAIQMAAHEGATIVATAGAPVKIEGAKTLGAGHVINYKDADFAEEVLRLFPDGVDLVEDFVGASYFQRHLQVLRNKGRIVMVGLLAPGPSSIDTGPMIGKRIAVTGFTLRPQNIAEKGAIVDRFKSRWLPRLVDGSIRPVIHAVLPFAQMAEAHRIIEDNENFGKVMVTVP